MPLEKLPSNFDSMKSKVNDQALQFCVVALARMVNKASIKKTLAEKFSLGARSAENYLARAREEIRQRAGRSLDDLKIDAAAYYQSIMADQTTAMRERILALEGFVRLFGLARPERIEVSGPDGGEIKVANKPSLDGLTPEQLAVLRAAIQKSKQ